MTYKMKDTSGNVYLMNYGKTTVSRSYSVKYSTAGTYYWTAPTNVTAVTSVQVAGAGGGYGWNCDCDCDCCGGDGCIISGSVLTKQGYVDVTEVIPGMVLVDENGNDCVLKAVVSNRLQDRKAVVVGNCVFTDDHAYIAPNGKKCTVNFNGYVRSLSTMHTDGVYRGRYVRHNLIYLAKDAGLAYEIKEMGRYTKTYTLIVENADFVQMDGVIASCAREVVCDI